MVQNFEFDPLLCSIHLLTLAPVVQEHSAGCQLEAQYKTPSNLTDTRMLRREGSAEFCSAGIVPSLQMANHYDLGHTGEEEGSLELVSFSGP